MDTHNKLWFSLAVVQLAAWASLADVTHPEGRMKHDMSALRPGALRFPRMVGGTLAPHVPWQAMVYLGDRESDGGFAGGTLISDRWVLTTGRNLFVKKQRQDTLGKEPLTPKVYLGISHRAGANASTEHPVEKVVLHPGFQNQSDWDNDLALIQLKHPVAVGDRVTPIPLPEPGQDLGSSGVIAGWGQGALFTHALSLKHLVLSLANQDSCKNQHKGGRTPKVDDNMFCTAPTSYEENVCYGDAGGALAVRDPQDGQVYAAGILSFDRSCRRDMYAVYMKISAYLPWIHAVLRGDTEGSSALRSAVMAEMYARQP